MKPFFKKKPVKEQMTPFKDLTFSEKVRYIWEYYKYFMLAAVLVIIAVVSFVISFQRNNYTTAFSMVIIDGKMTGYDTDQDVSASQQKIYTLASTGSIDGYIASPDYIDYFSTDKEPFLTDLREVLTDKELETLAGKIIYYTKEDGTKIPIALDLTDTKIKTETDFTMDNPCYGIVVTAPNLENAVAFIRYAFDL